MYIHTYIHTYTITYIDMYMSPHILPPYKVYDLHLLNVVKLECECAFTNAHLLCGILKKRQPSYTNS